MCSQLCGSSTNKRGHLGLNGKRTGEKNSNFTLILFFRMRSSSTPWIVDEQMEPFHSLLRMPCYYRRNFHGQYEAALSPMFKDSGNCELFDTQSKQTSTVNCETLENQRQMEASSKPINNIFLLVWTHKKTTKNQNFSFHFYSNTQRNLHTKKNERVLLYVISADAIFEMSDSRCKKRKTHRRRWARASESGGWAPKETKVDIARWKHTA